jgi:hypothetical protein
MVTKDLYTTACLDKIERFDPGGKLVELPVIVYTFEK